mmetsp:Transcript_20364/g.49240  ORF Transcript_20364/g.49240 Transcript_20364/m.49240 type:complete len:338 (+) Transcript_20364:2069-3082(+)
MILITTGGFLRAFRSLMSAGLTALRASSASASAGFAASRSFSTLAFSAPMVVALELATSAITFAEALTFSAEAVATEISLRSSPDFLTASASTISDAASSTFIFPTSSCAWNSFSSPELILSASTLTAPCSLWYTDVYDLMKERYDLGVTYTLRLNLSKYSRVASWTILCTFPMCAITPRFTSSDEAISNFEIKASATFRRPSSGHGRNQSTVVQLMRPGNLRQREDSRSPTGDMHRMMWRLLRALSWKYRQRLSAESMKPLGASFFAIGRMSPMMPSCSSFAKRPDTSPVERIWLMYSRKPSSLTSASVKMNDTERPLRPAVLKRSLRSSKRLLVE